MIQPAFGSRSFATGAMTRAFALVFIFCLVSNAYCLLSSAPASAEDDVISLVEQKRAELKAKEDAIKTEEQRLDALKKDVGERIDKYTALLDRLESTLKKIEQIKDDRMEQVVKAYEAMPPDEAAVRLAALDEGMAVKIMMKMKSKKAGAIMALMDPAKAAAITKNMVALKIEK